MTLKELSEKGTIDVADDITFQTHAEVLRLFGSESKVVQRSFLRQPVETNIWISFWIFYQDDANDWENTWGFKEEIAFENRKYRNDEYLAEMAGSLYALIFRQDRAVRTCVLQIQGGYVFDQCFRPRPESADTGALKYS